MDISSIEADKIKFDEDKKKFNELLTRIVDIGIQDDEEFENTLNSILIESNSGNLFEISDAFVELLKKISDNEKYKKIYKHLKIYVRDIYEIL